MSCICIWAYTLISHLFLIVCTSSQIFIRESLSALLSASHLLRFKESPSAPHHKRLSESSTRGFRLPCFSTLTHTSRQCRSKRSLAKCRWVHAAVPCTFKYMSKHRLLQFSEDLLPQLAAQAQQFPHATSTSRKRSAFPLPLTLRGQKCCLGGSPRHQC